MTDHAWFSQVGAELRAAGIGHPVGVIDLDALDHNVDVVKRHLGKPRSVNETAGVLPNFMKGKEWQRLKKERIEAFGTTKD